MLGNFTQVEMHISQVMPQLVQYAKRVQEIQNELNHKIPFLDTLANLEEAYVFNQDFSVGMKVEMVNKLKEEYDRGFVFI